MGMFDTFVMDAPCAKCGAILSDWQSKQLDCLMVYYHKGDRVPNIQNGNVVAIDRCGTCNFHNWARIKIKDYIVSEIEVVMPFDEWVKRIMEIDELLGEVFEPSRDTLWDTMNAVMEEYRDKFLDDNESMGSSVSYDVAWYVTFKKIFDWLPVNVVRAFFKDAMEGNVK